MPYQDFDEVEDDGFDIVPDGNYECRIASVTAKQITQGEVWKLRLEIVAGTHSGKHLGDDLLWWGGGLKRTKACLSAMGFEMKGGKVWHPSDLIGMPVTCQIVTKTREANGKEYTESKPTFRGYWRDSEKPWNPQTVPAPKPQQSNLPEDTTEVPF